MPAQTSQAMSFVDIKSSLALQDYLRITSQRYQNSHAVDLFLPPHFTANIDDHFKQSFAESFADHGRMSWVDLLGLLDKHACLSILGGKGSGKSAFMAWLIKEFACHSVNPMEIDSAARFGDRVPFYISATDLPMDRINNWDSLWRAYVDGNKDKLGDLLVSDEELVNRLFASGQALLMIDSLDDVADRHARETLDLAIIEGLKRYPLCKCLMGLRLYHNSIWSKASNDIDMASVYLESFNRMEAQEFVDGYCRKELDSSAEHNLSDVFKEAFSSVGDMPEMAGSPVMLNMMCHAYSRPNRARHYRELGSLPINRIQIIQDITEVYLSEAIQKRDRKFPDEEFGYDHVDLRRWLGKIALKIQDERIGRYNLELLIKKDEIKALLKDDMIGCGTPASLVGSEIDIVIDCLSDFIYPLGAARDGQVQYSFFDIGIIEHFAAHSLKTQAELDTKVLTDRRGKAEYTIWNKCWISFFEQIESQALIARYRDLLCFDDNRFASQATAFLI